MVKFQVKLHIELLLEGSWPLEKPVEKVKPRGKVLHLETCNLKRHMYSYADIVYTHTVKPSVYVSCVFNTATSFQEEFDVITRTKVQMHAQSTCA